MSIQDLFDLLSSDMQKARAESQMTLGDMIAVLDAIPKETQVPALSNPHSYRGFYEDLAFQSSRDGATISASSLLDVCKSCIGRKFMGYKGGEYVMSEDTPLWVAEYGRGGDKLVEFGPQGFVTEECE